MKVAKFGGSSLADANQIKKVCKIITSDPERKIIVVSAPGKRFKTDIKVTDMLIQCAEAMLTTGNADKEVKDVIARFESIANDLAMSSDIIRVIYDDIMDRVNFSTEHKGKYIDNLKAAGEDNCAKLVAEYLNSIGIKAQYVSPKDAGLYLTESFGNARILPESYENLGKLAHMDGIVVFPGFFGYTKNGNVVTFSRGGSDITGSILAAAVNADLYENFTDVDCIYAVNPNLVENPTAITELTYREMRELAYAGFSVFHEEALTPVYYSNIPVNVKNTNNPSAPGTTILPKLENPTRPVVGVAGDKGFCSIYVRKYLMNHEIGFGRKLLEILESEGISYEHSPTGIDDISVVIREKQLTEEIEKRLVQNIKEKLKPDDIYIQRGQALIMLVGEGCKNTIGIASKATKALADAGINIEMINQGSSEASIMFGIRGDRCNDAIVALYKAFFE
ncbi:MAG: aspartate kinase [Clostridia bacterium]|jgi:aspartate kinase|nr:aspartate kinase [Clostridiaceae bacterium]